MTAAQSRRNEASMVPPPAPPHLARLPRLDDTSAPPAGAPPWGREIRPHSAPLLVQNSPVLAAFRRAGDAVEAHMAAFGVSPEEPELAALLDVSSRAGDVGRVYEYMHKLRKAVDRLSEETAEVVEAWFRIEKAAMASITEWNAAQVNHAIVTNGGGCHRLGWCGTGPWAVKRVRVGADGECGGCGCHLACVDINAEETWRFTDSVAGLALERETKSNFSLFQDWLEAHKKYEAIVNGANIALYQQIFAESGFCLTQLDAIITELRARYSGKWPLVILHNNKRNSNFTENSSNRHLIGNWRTNGGTVHFTKWAK